MIIFTKGDLFEADADVLVNTVKIVGVMGKGIALAFKQKFPSNFQVYQDGCRNGELKIGKLLVVVDYDLIYGQRTIINFPTKTHWRLPSEYTYVERGLIALKDYCRANKVVRMAMPALGCGNGGLNWVIVKRMIEKYLEDIDSTVLIYES